MVDCPICGKSVQAHDINRHLDSNCNSYIDDTGTRAVNETPSRVPATTSFFKTPNQRLHDGPPASTAPPPRAPPPPAGASQATKRTFAEATTDGDHTSEAPTLKKAKANSNVEKAAPLAERMRPRTLDEVHGQDLVGADGVIRGLIESGRVPSMILWGGPGTGKTTIARLIAQDAGTRFVEINSTTSGVGEVKKLFIEAKNELSLTGRKTIVFCDEIHRFNKAQQDTFLGPVEAGIITLIGATTENPSFKVINALLSRCRIFTLAKLTDDDVLAILKRALAIEPPSTAEAVALLTDNDYSLLRYLSSFADGDARTALNLLSLAIDLSSRPGTTEQSLKQSLTKTFVYDTKSDFHYDTISAFHKSIRGSNPDAALYYLARMLRSGEDPLYVSRRMVVIASEDVGLADNSLLTLAIAAHTAAERIGMPECAINLAHCCVALATAPKSTRSYKAYKAASKALDEPGIAGLPIPLHLRNAPTKLMREMGYGKEYKYNPNYRNGEVLQEYLPERLEGRRFLLDLDMGEEVDEELETWRRTLHITSKDDLTNMQRYETDQGHAIDAGVDSILKSSPPTCSSSTQRQEAEPINNPGPSPMALKYSPRPRRASSARELHDNAKSLSRLSAKFAQSQPLPASSPSPRHAPPTPRHSVRSLLRDPVVLARDRALLSSSPPRSSDGVRGGFQGEAQGSRWVDPEHIEGGGGCVVDDIAVESLAGLQDGVPVSDGRGLRCSEESQAQYEEPKGPNEEQLQCHDHGGGLHPRQDDRVTGDRPESPDHARGVFAIEESDRGHGEEAAVRGRGRTKDQQEQGEKDHETRVGSCEVLLDPDGG